MAGSPGSNFDPMSAAAVAAAAAAAASAGTYSPHPASQNQYMTAAAARGQQPYPSTMMIGRFNMGGMPSNSAPGAIPTPPPPASAMQAQHPHQPPPLGSSGSSMSVPSTPTRPIGMSRMNSHGQSSTTQRKRYLCTVCQKMFARPSTLSTHMHSHTGEKPYECTWDGCEKRFSVMSNLRRHQRIHERQRQKYANVQQQHNQMQPADTSAMASGDESSDESTTPLASQIHAVAPHAHHHRHPHHMSPPPAFNQPPMLASHAQGGMSAPLGMHHHGLPALHHPHQPHQQLQQHPHHHPHHMMAPVASQQHYQHQHYQHQQPQVSMPDTLTKHSVGPNSIHDDSATVMSANEEPVPMLNGASTTSTNTINPTTPQSSGLKE
ncbi:hypothetical protein FBU31_004862 [Coemansia sp. 'formosensis']|nr:hypothetical protein FBU31_004862 [Coemansia sp. 'formosensis']